MKYNFLKTLAIILPLFFSVVALGQEIEFKDPAGDDIGPGTYTYPTDSVYKKGSFDLLGFSMKASGERFNIDVQVNSTLEDPWKYGVGFSTQMIFVFIDLDNKKGSGFTDGIPGSNIKFFDEQAWDKCIIISPQTQSRIKTEIAAKAKNMASSIIVPVKTKGSGKTISTSIAMNEIGTGDPTKWGYQIVMLGNEGFPSGGDLLSRRVNEYGGQHKFGGGNDEDCDPNVLDLFAGKGIGSLDEVRLQRSMLAYQCPSGSRPGKTATLTMVRK